MSDETVRAGMIMQSNAESVRDDWNELLPCSACGGKAIYRITGVTMRNVHCICEKCGRRAEGVTVMLPEDPVARSRVWTGALELAAESWNGRKRNG